jgi:3-carboxy-cis,cis-muconate cycloisomerase
VGRTLLQDAAPVTFELRAAQWLAGIAAADRNFAQAEAGIALQFGGAVGTRTGLDGKGAAVAAALGKRLGIPVPPAPWHSERSRVALLASALGLVTGAVGKVARDIGLLTQSGIAELREPSSPGGWQAEAPALTELFLIAGGSADAVATILEGLEIDTHAMARNLQAAGLGTDVGEASGIVTAILAASEGES